MVLALFLVPSVVHAQATGKISGVITDASSGETLIGGNVLVVGTTLGAVSDSEGDYFIIGVPVGTYDIQVSYTGYQTETVTNVEVNAGYTRELNFSLQPGLELEEIVVEYERPLIQKDAVGVPKIVTSEEIQALPVRGATNIAKIQAGVVSKEGSGTLNIRGGRGGEVSYYVDGVKGGSSGVPQSAVQEQEMQIGSISARYGDAMSGVINIATKSGRPEYFGSLEGLSSNEFDQFGYNLVSATLGGPLPGLSDKVHFFVSAEYGDRQDRNPRSAMTATLPNEVLEDLVANPMGLRITHDGNSVIFVLPNLADEAELLMDEDGHILYDENGNISFSDGSMMALPEDFYNSLDADRDQLAPVSRLEYVSESDFSYNLKKRGLKSRNLNMTGNLTWNVIESGRLRVGASVQTGDYMGSVGGTTEIFRAHVWSAHDYLNTQIHARWTQYLSQSTFYQVQAEWRLGMYENYDPRFGKTEEDWWRYADIDHPVHATIYAYKNFDPGTNSYINRYQDGRFPGTVTTAGLVSTTGGRLGYSRGGNRTFRMHGSATTQIGINQIEFGAEYQQGHGRSFWVNTGRMSRYFADGCPEEIGCNPDGTGGYTSLAEMPLHLRARVIGVSGYYFDGRTRFDSEEYYFQENGYFSQDEDKPEEAYLVAPHKPVLFGGFVQDKIEFRDIVLNLGLRVDVYDNNRLVWKDKYARRPIVRVSDLSGVSVPANIGGDYAVYFSGDEVIGYRDLDGNFYDTNGQGVQAAEILLNGLVEITNTNRVEEDMFEDFKPIWSLMPRVGVSFPITDEALFFASYGVVTQRPGAANATIGCLGATGCSSNPSLRPTTTTKYEIGFRQRLGQRSALTVNGFFHQINNLIQIRDIRTASPSAYSRYENVDFGTVKGLEFGYDLRRTAGLQINANYTLSFARGTGSGSGTTSTIVWIDETPPNFISPLSFDQRHKFNFSLDYSLGHGEGPTLVGTKLLQNFTFNFLATAGSGFPYTGVLDATAIFVSRAPLPKGAVNADRMPWSTRLDMRIQRRFRINSGARLTAFLWMQNVLNTTNVQNVWRYTGLPHDDGFLATAAGMQYLDGSSSPITELLYRHRNRSLGAVGIPRITRLGLRLDF